MIGVFLQLRAGCKACGRPVPVNALLTRTSCYSCQHPIEIPPSRWESLLERTVPPDEELGKFGSVSVLGEVMELESGREDPCCSKCRAPIPDEAEQFAARGFMMCGNCGARISVRVPPKELAPYLRDASLVIGEEAAQLAGHAGEAPKAASPVMLHCQNCRAPLTIDGSQRLVRCTYCSIDQYLPDELWLRLHPVKQVARYFLAWKSLADIAATKLRNYRWSTIYDAVVAQDGTLYCVGNADTDAMDEKLHVFALGSDLVPRWVADAPGKLDSPRLALDPRGRLFLWQERKHSLAVLSVADGSVTGALGREEPADATTHELDLQEARSVAVDRDGTILAVIGNHLARFSEEGWGVATWPPRSGFFGQKTEKLRKLYTSDGEARHVDRVELPELRDYATAITSHALVAVGWDGFVYLACEGDLVRFDRAGKIVYKTQLPGEVQGDQFGADLHGNAYLVVRDKTPQRVLVRVSPVGQVDVLTVDHLHGGLLRSDSDKLAVAPDGTTFHVAGSNAVVIVSPTGQLVHMTQAAIDDHASAARRASGETDDLDLDW